MPLPDFDLDSAFGALSDFLHPPDIIQPDPGFKLLHDASYPSIPLTNNDLPSLDHNRLLSRPVTEEENLYHSQEWSNRCFDFDLSCTASPPEFPFSRASAQRLNCPYPGCTSSAFWTIYEQKVHLKDHIHQVLNHWNDCSQRCQWPGCLSKATFKSKKALQAHLGNIHVDPLLCPEKGCKYRGPFRNNFDLKRHVKTIHSGEKELQIQCPFPECRKFPTTFVRKDKWLNHLRSGHDDSHCPITHCAEATKGKLVEHIKNFHGIFECGLGACEQQPLSRFTKFELIRHLEFRHGLAKEDIDAVHNAANQTSDHTVRPKDLPRETSWSECCLCCGRNGRERDAIGVICLDE